MRGLPSKGQCWVPGGLQPQRMSPRARRCREMCLPLPGWLWSWERILRCRQCLGLARQPLRMSHSGLYHAGGGDPHPSRRPGSTRRRASQGCEAAGGRRPAAGAAPEAGRRGWCGARVALVVAALGRGARRPLLCARAAAGASAARPAPSASLPAPPAPLRPLRPPSLSPLPGRPARPPGPRQRVRGPGARGRAGWRRGARPGPARATGWWTWARRMKTGRAWGRRPGAGC